jgi:hypothetical protein
MAKSETWNEEEWGKLEFREFDECPYCHCKNRFAVEALRGEIPEDKLVKKPPALGRFELIYDTPLYRITLTNVVDTCCRCGGIITVARSKKKEPLTFGRGGGDSPGLGGRGPRILQGR